MDITALFRAESGRATAGLARRLGDLDLAKDAIADAFVLALERWRDGVNAMPCTSTNASRGLMRSNSGEPMPKARGDVRQAGVEIASSSTEPTMTHNRYYYMTCAEVAERAGDSESAKHAYARALRYAGERGRRVIFDRLRKLDAKCRV